MNTKLTLRLNNDLINDAKNYARKEGKSLSQLVADYFAVISSKKIAAKKLRLKPKTSKLHGRISFGLPFQKNKKFIIF